MEQETTINYLKPSGEIYKEREIWAGALLGGTLAAGYMVAANYKAFGETDKVRKTWFVTVAATAFLFYILLFAPYIDRLPNQLFSLVCAGIIIVLAQMFQGERIRAHIRAGGAIQSWWKTVGAGFLGGFVLIAIFAGAAFVLEAVKNANITIRTYGTLKNDVSFDKNNVTEAEIDKLADGFRQAAFFDDKLQKSIDAKKIGNDYEITVYCSDAIRISSEAVGYFRNLREDLQKRFPDNKIIFNLVISTPDNIIKRLE